MSAHNYPDSEVQKDSGATTSADKCDRNESAGAQLKFCEVIQSLLRNLRSHYLQGS